MNAINLLPPDLRRGSAAPTRSGIGVYAVLGALALAVVLVGVTAVLKGRVSDREAQLIQAEAAATEAERQAAAVSHYKGLAAQTGTRVQGVRAVSEGRIEWGRPLTQLAEAVGTKVGFTSLNASSASGAGSGGSNPLRGSETLPALEITGCAQDHPAVARLMTRFRAMDDVKRVSLSSSSREAGANASGTSDSAGGGASGSCTGGLDAQFSIVIFFDQGQAAASTAAGTPAATGNASGTTTTSGGQ